MPKSPELSLSFGFHDYISFSPQRACYMSLQPHSTEEQLFERKNFSRSTVGEIESVGKVAKKWPDPNERRVWGTGGNGKNQKLSVKLCPSITMTTTVPLCTGFGLEPGSSLWNVGD